MIPGFFIIVVVLLNCLFYFRKYALRGGSFLRVLAHTSNNCGSLYDLSFINVCFTNVGVLTFGA